MLLNKLPEALIITYLKLFHHGVIVQLFPSVSTVLGELSPLVDFVKYFLSSLKGGSIEDLL